MALELDLGDGDIGAVGCARELLDVFGDAFYDFAGVAAEEDFPDEIGGVVVVVWLVERRVEGIGQRKMLLGDNPAGYSLDHMSVSKFHHGAGNNKHCEVRRS